MAGFLEGIGRTIGGLQAGILDARMSIQAKHQSLLADIVGRRNQQQQRHAGGFLTQQLGHAPITLENLEGPGQEQIAAGRGLLADPRFQDNKTELEFGAALMSNPLTAQLGQSLLSNVINTQQLQDATLTRQGRTDADALTVAQLGQANKQRDVALAMRDDAVRELGPVAAQVPEIQAAMDILASGSTTDAIASVFQFMQAIEPGGIVREGEQGMVRGVGGLSNKLAQLINTAEGEGLNDTTRQQLANTMIRIIKPRFAAAEKRRQQIRTAAEQAQLQGQNVDLASGGFGEFTVPDVPQIIIDSAVDSSQVDMSRFEDAER